MDETAFWKLVDQTRAGRRKVADHIRALDVELQKVSPEALLDFDSLVWDYFLALDRKELWAAADTIMGGCSDDKFDYFKQWLILQGREVVLKAVRNPDSLADLPLDERTRTELLLSLAKGVYEDRLHAPMPEHDSPFTVNKKEWPEDRLKDYRWTAETTSQLFPRLTAKAPWKTWR